MDTLWITGFEPLDQGDCSADLGRKLAKEMSSAGFSLLPASYERAQEELEILLEEKRPKKLLMLGYAEDAHIRVENFAYNKSSNRPDADGQTGGNPLYNNAPLAYQSTWNMQNVKANVEKYHLPFEFSQDAGGFLPNAMYYYVLDNIADFVEKSQVLLVHVSRQTEWTNLKKLLA